MTENNNKPWDAQLAYFLILPLRNTFITPNHLTFLRLSFGIAAGLCLSVGDFFYSNLGAFCFVVSNFLDHTDGELARLTGKTSKTGHYFDLVCDALVNIFLFTGMGFGLLNSGHPEYTVILAFISGISVAAIFHMRNQMEAELGKAAMRQPHKGGVEAEDVLYLLPIVTYFELNLYFILLASIGATVFCLWVMQDYISFNKTAR